MKSPKQEKIVMTYVFEGVDCYSITRNTLGKYTIYKITNDNWQKLRTDDSAIKFDEIVEKDRSK